MVDFAKKLRDREEAKSRAASRSPFWSDDFDMDLLNIFPDIEKHLGATAEVPLWTLGHTSDGRLNHPATWDSALFWFEKPNLERDKHGWVNVGGRVTNAAEVECTWLEALRDEWPHNYNIRFMPSGEGITGTKYSEAFEPIMYHLRRWRTPVDDTAAESLRRLAWRRLIDRNVLFAEICERWRIGRAEFPYFTKGSVPWRNGPRRLDWEQARQKCDRLRMG